MLESLRNFSKSWIMRGILLALAATFVLFFGTDFGGGGRSGGGSRSGTASVVEVGDTNFTIYQIGRAFNDQIQRASTFTGRQYDTQTAIQAGLLDQTIAELVTRTLFDQAAQEFGITTSLDAASTAIRSLPQFQGPSGRFERAQFEQFLSLNGQSEAEFVNEVRLDLLRTQYIDTIRNAVTAPAPLTDAVFKRRGERRVVDLVVVPQQPGTQVGNPDEAQLLGFYDENREAFETPEFRVATLASMDVETLAREVVIPEEELREEYELRSNEFSVPEQRAVSQATFLSRDDAARASALIQGGKSFDEAAEEISGLPPIDIGSATRTDIPVAELADAAFTLPAGAISEPVESDLGWHLIRVGDITPGRTIPFADVRDSLRSELALEEARDLIFDVLNDVEDGLAGGASIDEVARDSNLTVVRVDGVSRFGALRPGQTEVPAALTPEVLQSLFEIEDKAFTETVESSRGGFTVVQLDDTIAPRIPALDEVREQAIGAWQAQRISEIAEETAEKIADRVRGGADMQSLASEFGARYERTPAFDRTGDGSTIPGELIAPIFEAGRGEVFSQLVSAGAAVAKVVDIETADLTDPAREELAAALTGQIANDLVTQLSVALQDQVGVEVDREALEDAFAPR